MKTVLFAGLFIFAFHFQAQVSDFETIDFQKADKIASDCKNESLSNMPQLVHKLTANLPTDVERFRAIYRWVCGNIANDYGMYLKNMRKRQRFKDDSLKLNEWNDRFRKRSFKKMLDDHSTICTGYAYLIKELASLANIECEIINGFARTSTVDTKKLKTPNHSWNSVKLNGKWYLCDPTWASGIPNATTNLFEFNYNDGFFLANPKLFAINHYPVDTKWFLLESNEPTFENFLEAPIFYGSAYTNLSAYNEPKKMHNTVQKYETVVFNCELSKSVKIEEISLLIDNGSNPHKVHPESTSIKNNSLIIKYRFETSGFYDVHLYFRTDLISTYTFRVN